MESFTPCRTAQVSAGRAEQRVRADHGQLHEGHLRLVEEAAPAVPAPSSASSSTACNSGP